MWGIYVGFSLSGLVSKTFQLIRDKKKRKIFVANAGDSRCVMGIDGKATEMSKDHKPEC